MNEKVSKKVSLVFEVDSVEELRDQIESFYAALNRGAALSTPPPRSALNASRENALGNGHANGHAEPPETVQAVRRGRPPKKSSSPEAAEEVEEQENETPESDLFDESEASSPTTKEEMTDAAKELNSALGIAAVREVLKKFECEKVSEIAPRNFADVVRECKAMIAKAGKTAKVAKGASARA